jgi:hypothetical protein
MTDKRREMLAEFGRIKPNSRKMGWQKVNPIV